MKNIFSIIVVFSAMVWQLHAQHVYYYADRMRQSISDSILNEVYPAAFNIIPDTLYSQHNWFVRKLLFEDFVNFKYQKFSLEVNPLLLYEVKQEDTARFIQNTRALRIRGAFGYKFSFYTAFFENQAFFPDYLNDYIQNTLVAPGQGASKIFKTNGHDFSRVESNVNYAFHPNFLISVGQGKHFVGDGYRSLIWSDNAYTYPYASLSARYKGWKYLWMISEHNFFRYKYYAYHIRRATSLFDVSWQWKDKIGLGFSEITVWQPRMLGTESQLLLKLNPVPLVNTLLSVSNASEINSLQALRIVVKPFSLLKIYSQYVVDLDVDKKTASAYQIGFSIKEPDVLTKHGHKFLAAFELNMVGGGMYASADTLMSLSHYNQPLAHPSGNYFSEQVYILQYGFKRVGFSAKYLQTNRNPVNDWMLWNTDVSVSGLKDVMNISNKESSLDLKLYAVINPKTNLQLQIGVLQRKTSVSERFIYVGIQSQLYNYYTDF